MAAREFVFTSESVTEGHPDKVADQVSDTILDAVLADDSNGRVACETLVTTGLVVVAGEITTKTYVDIPKLVRDRIREIGYDRAKYGFDADTCGVMVAIDDESLIKPDVIEHVLRPILPPELVEESRFGERDFVLVNPTGKFVTGGPM